MFVQVTLSAGTPAFLAKIGHSRRGASPAGAPMAAPLRSFGSRIP
jgi:hypothetical protein